MIKREYYPEKEWQKNDPAELNMKIENLKNLDKIIKSQYKNINSIIIIRNGYIAFEKYYNGYKSEDTHHVASVTKSIISALIGIAIEKGYIKSVDEKILDFFPEYKSAAGDFQKRIITIKHILTMTAPFAWKTVGLGFEPLNRLRRQRNWITFILDILGKNGHIGKFQYSSIGVHLLSAIISRSTKMSAREFANKFLFKPIGMNEISDIQMKSFRMEDVFSKNQKGWIKDPQNITLGGWGLTLTPEDMARFGFLYLNNGNWNGKQIISNKWIAESTAMNENEYGYLWWLFDVEGMPAYTAAGSGGNHIFCIPCKDLVVVIASEIVMKARDRGPLLEEYILPSICRT